MEIRIIKQKISPEELKSMAKANYGDMVKGVVDIQKKVLALGGELHADAEGVLLKNGSRQEDLWGFNIFPDREKEKRIEYTSLINIRPSHENFKIEIQSLDLRSRVKSVIDFFIE